MRFVVPLVRALTLSTLLNFVLVGGSIAQQPKATATAAATPTSPATNDTSCELRVVNNLIQQCCSQVGTYLPGYRNCSNFRKTFDTLCKKSFGRSRCRSVSIWCPNGKAHAINLVQMSDGKWYLVEPQGWVYQDYPLPSPDLTDAAIAAVMPGCGCHSEVTEWAPIENTNPFICSGNEGLLHIYGDKSSSLEERCLACCKSTRLPPEHPDPEDFRKTCAAGCTHDLNLPGEKYCPIAYTGRACEGCCWHFSDPKRSRPKNACEDACKRGGDQWGEIPTEPTAYCANKTGAREECYSCCRHEKEQCSFPDSFSCGGWAMECVRECWARFPQPPSATPTIASSSSSAAAPKS